MFSALLVFTAITPFPQLFLFISDESFSFLVSLFGQRQFFIILFKAIWSFFLVKTSFPDSVNLMAQFVVHLQKSIILNRFFSDAFIVMGPVGAGQPSKSSTNQYHYSSMAVVGSHHRQGESSPSDADLSATSIINFLFPLTASLVVCHRHLLSCQSSSLFIFFILSFPLSLSVFLFHYSSHCSDFLFSVFCVVVRIRILLVIILSFCFLDSFVPYP